MSRRRVTFSFFVVDLSHREEKKIRRTQKKKKKDDSWVVIWARISIWSTTTHSPLAFFFFSFVTIPIQLFYSFTYTQKVRKKKKKQNKEIWSRQTRFLVAIVRFINSVNWQRSLNTLFFIFAFFNWKGYLFKICVDS